MSQSKSVQHWLDTPQNQWPESLSETLKNVARRLGMSGDGVVDCIEAWLAGGEKPLTYEEVSKIWRQQTEAAYHKRLAEGNNRD